jgi:alkanesulfonate monooxygenase SsuD/methylene tetrahydromethanopterin reductase-like flavin-dependent oxidoreductase (luciferase family)
MRLGAYLLPRGDLPRAIGLAHQADQLGYDSLWVTHGAGRDSFLVLAAYGQATRRVGLGTGVVPIYPRHPVAMAQEAATLAELAGGRFRLGIGVSHGPSMRVALGLDMAQPLDVMREYVAVVRAALGGRVRFEGRHYRVTWEAAFQPPSPPPPVYLAGLSAPMLELAGEVADGVVLWLCAPAYIREVARPALARGRAKAGKTMDGFEVAAAVPVAVTADVAGATATFRDELVRYLGLPYYRAMLRASGFAEALAAFDRDRDRRPAADAVPAALSGALGAVGDAITARAYVDTYRAAGVTLPAVRPIGGADVPHAADTLAGVVASKDRSGG